MAMTALAHMYAQTLLNAVGPSSANDPELKEKLQKLVAGNGNLLIPGASLLGFPSSFVVLPNAVNETSRDLFLQSVANYLFKQREGSGLYKSFRRLTIEFQPADVTAAGRIRDEWIANQAPTTTLALVQQALPLDLVQSDSPFYPMAVVAFKHTLDALLGVEAKYAAVRKDVEASDASGILRSDLFKVHYLAVAFWFTTITLPFYMVGLVKGDVQPAAVPDLDKALATLFRANGASINAFLSEMGLRWSRAILNVPVGPADESASEVDVTSPLRETIDPAQALTDVLAQLAEETATPPMISLLSTCDRTGDEKLFLKQLKLMTAYYAAAIAIGDGKRVKWADAHVMIQRSLGYTTPQEMIRVILAKGPALSTSGRAVAGGGGDDAAVAELRTNLAKAEADARKERETKEAAVQKAVIEITGKKAGLIATLSDQVKRLKKELEEANERNPNQEDGD